MMPLAFAFILAGNDATEDRISLKEDRASLKDDMFSIRESLARLVTESDRRFGSNENQSRGLKLLLAIMGVASMLGGAIGWAMTHLSLGSR